jgi:hypothetical protein
LPHFSTQILAKFSTFPFNSRSKVSLEVFIGKKKKNKKQKTILKFKLWNFGTGYSLPNDPHLYPNIVALVENSPELSGFIPAPRKSITTAKKEKKRKTFLSDLFVGQGKEAQGFSSHLN